MEPGLSREPLALDLYHLDVNCLILALPGSLGLIPHCHRHMAF